MPPAVSERRMNSTLVMMPEPETPEALRSSQGIAFASGEALFWRSSPLTALPSFDVQIGPAPWLPTLLPEESISVASGA